MPKTNSHFGFTHVAMSRCAVKSVAFRRCSESEPHTTQPHLIPHTFGAARCDNHLSDPSVDCRPPAGSPPPEQMRTCAANAQPEPSALSAGALSDAAPSVADADPEAEDGLANGRAAFALSQLLARAAHPARTCPPHLMPHRLAEELTSHNTRRAHNYPPIGCVAQRYGPSELSYNAQQLGVKICASSSPDAGLGCVATRPIRAGHTIGWMWGAVVSLAQWEEMNGPHGHDRSFADDAGEEDYLTPIRAGVWRCVSGVEDTRLQRCCIISSECCPMAYLNQPPPPLPSPEPGRAASGSTDRLNIALVNAKIRISSHPIDLSAADCFKHVAVVATADIAVGAEIFIKYSWSPQAWAAVNQRMRVAKGVTYTPLAPLCALALRRQEQQEVQWANLVRFVRTHQGSEPYASFPYAIYTSPISTEPPPRCFAKRLSTLLPGVFGVFLKRPQRHDITA